MTAVDYAVLLILIASVLLGALRGFVRETLSVAAWVAAFWSANRFSPDLSGMLPFSGEPVRILAAFVAIFLATLIGAAIVTKLVSGIVKQVGLGWVDGLLGFIFGLVRGLLIVMVLVLLSGLTSFPESETWKRAQFRDMLETGAFIAGSWLPAGMTKHMRFGDRKLNYK